ncbi:hypothetical protein BJ165DRAFT_1403251 [Panaeolus papilionaceus]|nr:hypothetical protein BJ165DRAFT_1403251 [Panaeolus papilionaceus]
MSASASAPHTSVFQGSLTTSSVSENNAAKSRNRGSSSTYLKPLYDEWNRNPGQMPSLDMRKSLKSEVEKITGTTYGLSNVNQFFQHRIGKFRGQNRDTRYPSLSKEAIDHLDLLLKTSNNPTPELVGAFAQLVSKAYPGCTHQDIAAYISYAQADQQRFPTPTSISSPGSGPSSPATTFQPFQPPIISPNTSKVEHSPQLATMPICQPAYVSPPPHTNRKYTPSPPPTHSNNANIGQTASHSEPSAVIRPPIKAECTSFPPHPIQSKPLISDTRRRASLIDIIVGGVEEALSMSTSSATPSSTAEFDAMFSRIEKLSHSLSRQHNHESHAAIPLRR